MEPAAAFAEEDAAQSQVMLALGALLSTEPSASVQVRHSETDLRGTFGTRAVGPWENVRRFENVGGEIERMGHVEIC